MARYAPIATLAAVAALGGALFVVNEVNNPDNAPTLVGQSPSNASEGAPGDPGIVAPAPPAPGAPVPPPPGAPPAAPPVVQEQVFTGRSAGDEVTVAVAVKDGRASGYVCDGEAVESWLEGTLQGDQLTLEGRDGTTINATVTPDSTYGTVNFNDEELPFSAAAVEGDAGLFEGNASVRGVATRVGWIVTNDGEVTGVANFAGQRGPAPELDPADPYAVEFNGVPMAVSVVDGSDRVIRR